MKYATSYATIGNKRMINDEQVHVNVKDIINGLINLALKCIMNEHQTFYMYDVLTIISIIFNFLFFLQVFI